MNKSLVSLVCAALGVVLLALTGCGGAKTKMDTVDFEKAFAGADAAVKGQADEAVKALKAGKMFEGATALANLAKSAEKLEQSQKDAMVNLGATIQLIISEGESDIRVYQAVDDMINTLDGRDLSKVGTTPDRVVPKPAAE
ncbi:MAG: hypothetical protein JNK85_18090 [Verrucomicrobiales bacterium]|nr:hypothetical protein [Verrucomicrobiales bacterium]